MAKFLLRRLANYVLLVAAASTLAYLLAAATLDPCANFAQRQPPPPPAVINQTLSDLNMNDQDPLLQRYVTWASGVVHGDFGKTIDGGSATAEMGRRIGVSLRLLLIGTILGTGVGVLLGAWSAVKQYRFTDRTITFASFLLLAIPVFLTGVLLKYGAVNVNDAVGAKIFEYTGEYTPAGGGGFFAHALGRVQHLIVPTLTLVLVEVSRYSRYERSMLLDVLGSDYLRTARAKGLRRHRAILKHGLRTSLIPVATFFAYNFGLLLTGAIFVEKIFAWHGMGEWFIDSIHRQDVNSVAAVSLFAGVMVLVAGLLSDIILALLDPRVRVS